MIPIVGTVQYFGLEDLGIKQIILDLSYYRYKVFDALGMWLTGRIKPNNEEDGKNVLVALSNIYVNTSGVRQWVEYQANMDLELDYGSFHTVKFEKKVRQWNEDELAIRNRETLNLKRD